MNDPVARLVFLQLALTGVALGAALPVLAWRTAPHMPRDDAVIAMGLALIAYVARYLAPWGPHDIRSRNAFAFGQGWDLPWDHGVGHVAVIRAMQAPAMWMADETDLMALGPVMGATVVACVFLWARAVKMPRPAAAFGGLALALWGYDLRMGHTDAPQLAENALVALALVTMAVFARVPSLRAAVCAGALVGLASTQRPEGMLLPLLLLLPAGHTLPRALWSHRWLRVGVAVAALVALPHAVGMIAVHGMASVGKATGQGAMVALRAGPLHFLPMHPSTGNVALSLLILLGAGMGRTHVALRLTLLGMAVSLALLVPGWTPEPTDSLGIARHQLRSLPWFALLVGLGADTLARWRPPVSLAGAGAVVVVACAWTWPTALAPTTLGTEYRFFSQHLADVPDGCLVVAPWVGRDTGLVPPEQLIRQRRLPLGFRFVDPAGEVPAHSCVVAWRGARCLAADPDGPDCAPWDGLDPLAEADLPSRGWIHERYRGDTVRVGFYWLRRPTSPAP